jgi:hypothetical protein
VTAVERNWRPIRPTGALGVGDADATGEEDGATGVGDAPPGPYAQATTTSVVARRPRRPTRLSGAFMSQQTPDGRLAVP